MKIDDFGGRDFLKCVEIYNAFASLFYGRDVKLTQLAVDNLQDNHSAQFRRLVHLWENDDCSVAYPVIYNFIVHTILLENA